MEGIQMIWQDRKRIFGLPISFTKYAMSEDRVFCTTGLITTREEEVLLYRVRDISHRRTLGQKLFGVGSVLVHSSDKSTPVLELKNIRDSAQVKERLHRQVEACKLQRRMRVGEWMDDGASAESSWGQDDDWN